MFSDPVLLVWLFLFLLMISWKFFLDLINRKELRSKAGLIPPELENHVHLDDLIKISNYSADSFKLGIIEFIFDRGILLFFLLSGLLPLTTGYIESHDLAFEIKGLVFFLGLGFISGILGLPFDLLSIFWLEEKYGFNKQTLGGWLKDLVKSVALNLILGSLMIYTLLYLLNSLGTMWWLYAWITFLIIRIILSYLAPVLIIPLFHKLTPVVDEDLKKGIQDLCDRAKFKIKNVYQIDATKRTTRTNAFFTGFGSSRRVVLFDTLIQKHPRDEILASLAHEIGHWKEKHILKMFVMQTIFSLAGFLVAGALLDWQGVYTAFGLHEPVFYAGLLLLGIIFEPLLFFLNPVFSRQSRKKEFTADNFARKIMGTAEPLKNSLINLSIHNLGEIHPHPLYVSFYYSHPPILQRLKALNE